MIGTILGNIDGTTLERDVGTVMGSLVGYFDGNIDDVVGINEVLRDYECLYYICYELE